MLLTIVMWTILAALLVMQLAPHSDLGKEARRTLVEAPARLMLDLTWAKAGKAVLLSLICFALLLAGPEMIALLMMMGGDLAAVELVLAIWAASASGGLVAAWRKVAGVSGRASRLVKALLRLGTAKQTPRQRRRKRPPKPRKDEDEPGWAFA